MKNQKTKRALPYNEKKNFLCIFQGRNIQTGELAAIKVIKIETGDDFQQIEQEIMMLKACNHRNIIRFDRLKKKHFFRPLNREKKDPEQINLL